MDGTGRQSGSSQRCSRLLTFMHRRKQRLPIFFHHQRVKALSEPGPEGGLNIRRSLLILSLTWILRIRGQVTTMRPQNRNGNVPERVNFRYCNSTHSEELDVTLWPGSRALQGRLSSIGKDAAVDRASSVVYLLVEISSLEGTRQ